jgi:hypothetical protein
MKFNQLQAYGFFSYPLTAHHYVELRYLHKLYLLKFEKMKKNISILVIAMLLTLSVNAQINKVYLISFFTQREIEPGDFGNGLSAAISTLSKDSTFKTEKLIQNFYNKFITDFTPKFPFPIVSGNEAWGAQGYSNLLDDATIKYADWQVTVIENSLPIMGAGIITNKSAITKALTLYPDADAIMTVQLTFRLSKDFEFAGFGTAKVVAYANVRIYDKESNRKPKFKLNADAKSDDNFKFALGGSVFETQIIQKLVEQATKNLFVEMDKNFPKQIKKMENRLKK